MKTYDIREVSLFLRKSEEGVYIYRVYKNDVELVDAGRLPVRRYLSPRQLLLASLQEMGVLPDVERGLSEIRSLLETLVKQED